MRFLERRIVSSRFLLYLLLNRHVSSRVFAHGERGLATNCRYGPKHGKAFLRPCALFPGARRTREIIVQSAYCRRRRNVRIARERKPLAVNIGGKPKISCLAVIPCVPCAEFDREFAFGFLFMVSRGVFSAIFLPGSGVASRSRPVAPVFLSGRTVWKPSFRPGGLRKGCESCFTAEQPMNRRGRSFLLMRPVHRVIKAASCPPLITPRTWDSSTLAPKV